MTTVIIARPDDVVAHQLLAICGELHVLDAVRWAI
jgi:hypothetical protein